MKAFTNSALAMKPRKHWALPPSRPAARDRHLRRSSCSRGRKRCLFATRTRSGRRSSTCTKPWCFSRRDAYLRRAVFVGQRTSSFGRQRHRCGERRCWPNSYCRARTAVERLRSSLRGEELKIAFFENKLEVYESLVDICLRRQNSFEEAFAYIEQAKSRTLMDLLNQPVHVPSAVDPGQSELVRSIRNLREELNWYYNLIEREQLRPEERSQERVQQLEQQARSRETDFMRAVKEATVAEANEAGVQLPSN